MLKQYFDAEKRYFSLFITSGHIFSPHWHGKKQHTISSIGLVNKYLRHDLSNRPLPFFAQAQSRGVRAHP